MEADNPILVSRSRGNAIESAHRGIICVVDQNNHVIYQAGNIDQVSFTRSALKPFQVIPLIEAGGIDHFGLTLEEIAVICGSHNAEIAHVAAIRSILRKIGLDESALQCGKQPPTHRATRKKMELDGIPFDHIHNNCSGKHAGFLAYCVLKGWSIDDYLSPDHPSQQSIKQVVAEMHNLALTDLLEGEDGCSAPNFAFSIRQQAIGYKNLCDPAQFSSVRQAACNTILKAMAQYPYMVAGSQRYCTDLMQLLAPEVIGKTGADGVYAMAFPAKKWGCAIKIEDGKMGPQYNVAQAFIQMSQLFDPQALETLKTYLEKPVLNWNKHQVGMEQVQRGNLPPFNYRE